MPRNFLHWHFMTMMLGFIGVTTPCKDRSLLFVCEDESDLWSAVLPPSPAHVTMIQLPRDQSLSPLRSSHNSSPQPPAIQQRVGEFTTDTPTCPLSFWWKFLFHSSNIYVYEFVYDAKILNFEWIRPLHNNPKNPSTIKIWQFCNLYYSILASNS